MTHSTRTRRPGRASVAGQQALLTAATRRAPAASGCADASTWLTGRDRDRAISFADVAADDPNQTWALSTGDAYASARDMHVALSRCVDVAFDVQMVLLELACALSDLAAAVNGEYRPVGTDALAAKAGDIAEELADVPFPADLRMLMLAWPTEQAPAVEATLSAYDHRPTGRTVGYDLETAVAA